MYKLYEVVNILTNKIYYGFEKTTKIYIRRIKNREFKKDLIKLNDFNFKLSILGEYDEREDVLKEYNNLVNFAFNNNINIYNYCTKNKVVVKDLSGNKFKINTSDPRYISGELKHVSSGKIVVKDKNGNILTVNADDERYLKGEVVGHTKGKFVAKDKNGNKFSVSVEDERFLNGNLVGCTKNTNHKEETVTKIKNIFIKNRKLRFPNFNYVINTLHPIDRKTFIVYNYCKKHGNLIIKEDVFSTIYNKDCDKIYCAQCREDIIENVYDENYLNEKYFYFLFIFKKFNIRYKSENYVKLYFPYLYSYLKNYYNEFNNGKISWKEITYLFKNKLKERPKCNYKNCENYTNYSESQKYYNFYCETHIHASSQSIPENQIANFISSLISEDLIERNLRNTIHKELDIYIPNNKIAYEHNGIYYHTNTPKIYHFDKWNRCKNKDIRLISIWEDDWSKPKNKLNRFKQEIVKSLIKDSLNLQDLNIIFEDCIINKISYKVKQDFLYNNYIYENQKTNLNFGVFYKNELVYVFSLNKEENNTYEIIETCSKLYIKIHDIEKHIVDYILKNYIVSSIIVKVKLDYMDNRIYEKIGFKQINFKLDYWLVYKCKRCINTIENPKNKYPVIWDVGTITYKYNSL